MNTIEALIKKYDAPNHEIIRQRLRVEKLIEYNETDTGAFFRFINTGEVSSAIIASSGKVAEELLKYVNSQDKDVCIILPKNEVLPETAIKTLNRDIIEVLDCNAYCYVKKEIQLEEDAHIEKLGVSEADFVFDNYDEKDTSSANEIKKYIEKRPAYGYYEEGKLIGWVLVHVDGQIGVLHVLKEYRGRGIAKKLMRTITNDVIKSGRIPGCEIKRDNTASINVITSLGYEHFGQEVWIIFS